MRLFRSQPRIVLAGVDEAAAIAGLYSRAWEGLRGKLDERLIADQTPGSDEVVAWLKGGFEVFTAALDGVLVGVVRCSFPTGTCLVDRMAVDPERNSNGIGRALAEHAISPAALDGVLVGVVRCSFPTGTCLVDRMAVDPERNSNGIGRALAEHAIARA